MTKKERYKLILDYFIKHQSVAETELDYTSPYQLVVSVILSAQCTDKRVNVITKDFFKRFPDINSLSGGTNEEVFVLIKSCSYPNNKTKHLIGMAKTILEKFNGIVPDNIEDLQKLPGIGRKSANVIASVVYNKPAMAVDTHVFRVSERLGLTSRAKNPYQAEMQLIKYIPEDKIPVAHHWLLLHGRYVCQARKPKCDGCGLKDYCRYYSKIVKK